MVNYDARSFSQRAKSMLRVDLKRMGKSRLFYILVALALILPVIMTVMLTMMDGTVSTNPQTGAQTVMEGPTSTWQSLGTLPGAQTGAMDVMAMCNINMMFMGVAVFVCLFICDDFRSGYVKNLFTVRAKKGDYVLSKTVCGVLCGWLMLLAWFLGAVAAGAITGLSFETEGFGAGNLVMCMLAKLGLMGVFVPIFVLISVGAKQKAWLAICGSLGGGMLLFMTVSMVSPLDATAMHVLLCLAGAGMFAFGLGGCSKLVLKKSRLV